MFEIETFKAFFTIFEQKYTINSRPLKLKKP